MSTLGLNKKAPSMNGPKLALKVLTLMEGPTLLRVALKNDMRKTQHPVGGYDFAQV